jgi:single-stranded DNA-binding protein
MTNRVTIIGKLLDQPKSRTFEQKGGTVEIVSLWVEVRDDNRTDRFTVEINDGKAATTAKAMKKDVLVEVTGKLRHDRWKDKATNRWTGKVFVAIDPGGGTVRSKGMAPDANRTEQAA